MKIAIIGGGPGGYTAAIRAAQLGAEVTLIEKNALGGTCLNVGCIPTKALLHSTNLYAELKSNAAKNGIIFENLSYDFDAIKKRKNQVVKTLVNGVGGLMKANGVKVLKGTAKFKSAGELEVLKDDGTAESVSADSILIATGSVPVNVPIPGAELPGVVDSTGAMEFEKVPESLCVVGGGVIGVEIAQVYLNLGSKITIVEMLPDILMTQDADVVAVTKKLLKKGKADILTETKVLSIEEAEGGRLSVKLEDKDGNGSAVEAEKVLLCVGRRAYTDGLGLDEIGVKTERGKIVVNESFESSVKGIYAIGDAIGGIMLAHVAAAEGVAAVENICGEKGEVHYETVPSCIYCNPVVADVGLNERQAKEQGIDYSVGIFPLIGNGKALIEGEQNGLVKIIAEKDGGKILGVHMVGPSAGELIMEGALAIRMGATVDELITTVHAHPSVGESIHEAAHSVFGNPLNMPPIR